jgi:YD repeat-containing protein
MCTATSWDPTCWYNSITSATSTDAGASYSHAPAPTHLVASAPYQYVPDAGPSGLFTPSNIVSGPGGYYYSLLQAESNQSQQVGTCVMRTQNLADPTSWRAWDGSAFSVRFINPYSEPLEPPSAHVCQVVSFNEIEKMNQSVTYNTYFKKYMLVGLTAKWDPVAGAWVNGIYYSLSDDLVNWSQRQLLMQTEFPWTYTCGGPDPVSDPALLDPDSEGRNFENTDQRPYLYFTVQHIVNNCYGSLDRDLVRIPIEFSNRVPNGPVASFTAEPNPAPTGQTVTFDASASTDPDGSITTYRWDLDDNGTYETNTGTSPTATRSYSSPGKLTVWLRVTDNDAHTTRTTQTLTVDNRPPSASFTATPNPAPTGQTVTFDGSASADPDGSITNYTWDLDGNGSFETDTGTSATATRSYASASSVTVKLRVTDNDGSSADATRTVTVDNRPPSASFTATPNPALTGQTVTFDGSASTDPDGSITNYSWDLDGNGTYETDTGTSATATRSYASADTVTVGLRVTDNDDSTAVATESVTVDNRAPIASFDYSPAAPQTFDVIDFTSASTDPDGTVVLQEWDLNGDGQFDDGSGASAQRSFSSAGTYTVKLRVTDNDGASAVATESVSIGDQAPTASFGHSPVSPLTAETVTFDGSASADPDGSITNYKWDLDGNGSFETDTGTTATASRSYASASSVTVGLRVTDNDGSTADATRAVTVNDRPPTASFTATPNPALTGQTVTFNGSASADPDGSITNYKWDLDGNGSFETDTGTTATASRSYSSPGTVTVKLRVTDNDGSTAEASKAQQINFVAAVNFQPGSAPIPAGYTKDTGAAYATASGRGWVREDSLLGVHVALDLTANTVDRNAVTDQRLDTLIFMQAKGNTTMNKTPGAWELAVPAGTYTVTVSVGDPSATDSTHKISIEGQVAVAGFKPTSTTKFASATKIVAVTDGRLTIDAKGGTNTKLDYVDVSG